MNDKALYWLEMCDRDLISARWNLKGKQYLWVAFICHLIIEKSFKAVIAERTDKLPPKIHDLITLAEKGGIINELSESQKEFCKFMNKFYIEARYEDYKIKIASTLNLTVCKKILKNTEDFLCWIKQKLDK